MSLHSSLFTLSSTIPLSHSNGQSGIDIISLEDPSLCQSLFIYSMATGLIMVPLPPSLSRAFTHSPLLLLLLSLPPLSLPLSGHCSFSYLRESVVLANGFASGPTPSRPPPIPFGLWHRFTVTD